MVTPAARREAAAHLCESFEVSQRRACNAIGKNRSSVRYRSLRPDDGAVRARLRDLAGLRRRFGYRRLHTLLRLEGIVKNHKKLRRLYRDERLQVRRRGGRKRALGTRAPMALVADTSLSGARVGRELDAIVARRGKPQTIVSDSGTELTSTAILQ